MEVHLDLPPGPTTGPSPTPHPAPDFTAGLPPELARQSDVYLDLGILALLGRTANEFQAFVAPLAGPAAAASPPGNRESTPGRLPFVLVLPDLPIAVAMAATRQGETPGYVDMRPVEPSAFSPTHTVPTVPYLAVGVDTGADTLGVTPEDAGRRIAQSNRHPLTIAEGVAALLLNPGLLRRANCFQMLASRDGSRRIPSLWVTKQGAPRLGWCYAGMPHSWLGAASCAGRQVG